MHSSPWMLRALCILFLSSVASALLQDTCDEEIALENAEDLRIHECRACQQMEIEASANCPLKGFHCDTSLRMRSNVLSPGGPECSQLRCADANATLFVGRRRVTKVTCARKQWHSSKEAIAPSGVCARNCGVGVCRTLPTKFFDSKPDLLPFVPNEPDANNPCAWGTCPDGALAGDSTPHEQYPGTVKFSCTGDGTWSLPDFKRFAHVACKVPPTDKKCEMSTLWDKKECEASWSGYVCEEPAENSDSAFKCGTAATDNRVIVFNTISKRFIRFVSMTCDKTTGKWVYTALAADGPLTQQEFEAEMGGPGPYKHFCSWQL